MFSIGDFARHGRVSVRMLGFGSRQSASQNSPQPPRALSPRPLIRSSSRYTASWANGSARQD